MLVLDAERIRACAPMAQLVSCLDAAFRDPCNVPRRWVLEVPGGANDRLFFIMPAFGAKGGAVVKLATSFPDNPSLGLPTIQAAIVVFSDSGTPAAILDGTIVTYLRTGAASALASTYLSRKDAADLTIIGTGALAPYMAAAHCAVRPIERVIVVGRQLDRAQAAIESIRALVPRTLDLSASTTAEAAVRAADIVSCATSSAEPVLSGDWLKPGAFVDLVGSHSPAKREADDVLVQRARLFVDTFEGALAEAGDLISPLNRGLISRDRIEGELADLASGRISGRRDDSEIIMFKSVGTALEDYAAARMIVDVAHRS